MKNTLFIVLMSVFLSESVFASTCTIAKIEKKIGETCKIVQQFTAAELLQLSPDKENKLFLYENCGTSSVVVAQLEYPHTILSFANKPWKKNTPDFLNLFDASGEMLITRFKKDKRADGLQVVDGNFFINQIPVKRKFFGTDCLLKDNKQVLILSSVIENSKKELMSGQTIDLDFQNWQTITAQVLGGEKINDPQEKNKFLLSAFDKIINANVQPLSDFLKVNAGIVKISLKKKLESELAAPSLAKKNGFESFWSVFAALENEILLSSFITRAQMLESSESLETKLISLQSKIDNIEKIIQSNQKTVTGMEEKNKRKFLNLDLETYPLILSALALLLSIVSIVVIRKRN